VSFPLFKRTETLSIDCNLIFVRGVERNGADGKKQAHDSLHEVAHFLAVERISIQKDLIHRGKTKEK